MIQTLWIMRHGLAEADFDTDFNRALSEIGKQQACNIAQQLKAQEQELPERMIVSPFRRTQETAICVREELGLDYEFETDPMLVHFADHKILGDYLSALEETRVMIVSHMPIVARLCQYLAPECDIFSFQTAQTVKLAFDEAHRAQVLESYLASI